MSLAIILRLIDECYGIKYAHAISPREIYTFLCVGYKNKSDNMLIALNIEYFCLKNHI